MKSIGDALVLDVPQQNCVDSTEYNSNSTNFPEKTDNLQLKESFKNETLLENQCLSEEMNLNNEEKQLESIDKEQYEVTLNSNLDIQNQVCEELGGNSNIKIDNNSTSKNDDNKCDVQDLIVNIQKEESTESISRPDNLPIDTELKENNRKIDLIGIKKNNFEFLFKFIFFYCL